MPNENSDVKKMDTNRTSSLCDVIYESPLLFINDVILVSQNHQPPLCETSFMIGP